MRDDNRPARDAGRKQTKKMLRAYYTELRGQLTPEQREGATRNIQEYLLELLYALRERHFHGDPAPEPVVGLYRAFRSEVDVTPVADALRLDDWRTAFPVTSARQPTVDFYQVTNATVWREGLYGIMEPLAPGATPPCRLEQMLALIVPGVAFTKAGGRLGYGGGYYDRMLTGAPVLPVSIGVAFDCQLAADLPLESQDARMDYIVTENGVIACGVVH